MNNKFSVFRFLKLAFQCDAKNENLDSVFRAGEGTVLFGGAEFFTILKMMCNMDICCRSWKYVIFSAHETLKTVQV
jgi:hypothetical protein